jgi:CRISPR/Cas system-associated exonuclease Cas4 (RecB family)
MLTKSDFLTFLDAPLHLWAKKNGQLESTQPTPYSQYLIKQGYEVQKIAWQFLEHKVASEYAEAELSFEKTLIDGDYESRIDALVHDKAHDTYDMYEIKSSTSIHKKHEYDVTFQYLIGCKLLNLHKIYMVRVNRNYAKQGKIDSTQFFVVDDMTETVEKLKDEVYELRKTAATLMKQPEPPTQWHCYKPKSCPCKSLCHPNNSEYPIYDLYGGRQSTYDELLNLGILDLAQIPEDFKLTGHQARQIASLRAHQPIIDVAGIRDELGQLAYPLHFLDYETFAPGIPIFDGYSPYQNIVFQYSVHVLEEPDTPLKHFEYLVTDTGEPSEQILKRLTKVIGETGSIIVWNKEFECSRNDELAKLQPQYADRLSSINERTYDLIDPFRKGYYADYRFHGSFSIKDVLPVLVPELNYKSMEIGEGTEAMTTWWNRVIQNQSELDPETRLKTISNLLEYCALDTLAMVRIWETLRVIITHQ